VSLLTIVVILNVTVGEVGWRRLGGGGTSDVSKSRAKMRAVNVVNFIYLLQNTRQNNLISGL
jgi:hypothetical protein